MTSIKARKGNPFERLIAYNLKLLNFEVNRIDDNTKGIDLIAKNFIDTFVIECKFHKKFSWNQIQKIFDKTAKETEIKFTEPNDYIPIFIFKSNQQPILVMYYNEEEEGLHICTFQTFFGLKEDYEIKKIPKGYKIWKDK